MVGSRSARRAWLHGAAALLANWRYSWYLPVFHSYDMAASLMSLELHDRGIHAV